MNLVCPHCNHDHIDEVLKDIDAWISDEGPYETECLKCSVIFVVQSIVTYEFHTRKGRKYLEASK